MLSYHPQEVLLAQFSLYVHKSGLNPDSFHFQVWPYFDRNSLCYFVQIKSQAHLLLIFEGSSGLTHPSAPAGNERYKSRLSLRVSNKAVQSQKAVSAYFASKRILPFGFAEQYIQLIYNSKCDHFKSAPGFHSRRRPL